MDVKLGSSAGVCANRRWIGGDDRPHFGHDRMKPWAVDRGLTREDLAVRPMRVVQEFIFTGIEDGGSDANGPALG